MNKNAHLVQFEGKKALVLGVANERSLAWAVAQHLFDGGASVAFTYPNEAIEKRARPLAESMKSELILPCDVSNDQDIQALANEVEKKWGKLDILIHAVAFAQKEDLEGRYVDTSRDGFRKALEISAYSLVALSKAFEPLFEKAGGGTILTLSYLGAVAVVPNYNVMGVAKAALEASVRYLAWDLGSKKIRVNAISAGPVKTLAASGIKGFKAMLSGAEASTPLRENITATDVGAMAAFLCGPGGVHVSGSVFYVDSGAHTVSSLAGVAAGLASASNNQ